MSVESHREAVRTFYYKNLDRVKVRHKAYREANREKIKAYADAYRRKNGIKPRGPRRPPKPKKEKTFAKIVKESIYKRHLELVMNTDIQCQYCEVKVRKGSDEYFDGRLSQEGFSCGACLQID